jgi:type 1 fimbria pilin
MIKHLRNTLLAVTSTLLLSSLASAAPFTLDFEGVTTTYPQSINPGADVYIGQFYLGGTSTEGGNHGPNYGVTFSDGSVLRCLNSLTVNCSNVSRGGLGDAGSQKGALNFIMFDTNFINFSDGFGTSLALY